MKHGTVSVVDRGRLFSLKQPMIQAGGTAPSLTLGSAESEGKERSLLILPPAQPMSDTCHFRSLCLVQNWHVALPNHTEVRKSSPTWCSGGTESLDE